MFCLKMCLKRHARPRDTAFEADCVTQDAFNAGDVRDPGRSATDGVTIGINTDSGVTAEVAPAQCLIEQNARCCVYRRDDPRRNQGDIDSNVPEGSHQGTRSDIASAPAAYV